MSELSGVYHITTESHEPPPPPPPEKWIYQARLERVKDGDTFVLSIDRGGHDEWRHVSIRLIGAAGEKIDCPERSKQPQEAEQAAQFTADFCRQALADLQAARTQANKPRRAPWDLYPLRTPCACGSCASRAASRTTRRNPSNATSPPSGTTRRAPAWRRRTSPVAPP